MFIRRTATRNKSLGDSYYTYRLVRSMRVDGKVRQVTLLNLGRHFPVASDNWPILCSRIEEIVGFQTVLLPVKVSTTIEKLAQRYAAEIIARTPQIPEAGTADNKDNVPIILQEVDVDSINMLRPRSVGVEHVGLHALNKLGLIDIMRDSCGLTGNMLSCAIGNIIGRMAVPGSELSTWQWLQETSSLGELLEVDYAGLSHMSLYRASDVLIRHRLEIETALYNNIQSLFSLETTITLYDLTNTYFEGNAKANPKAARGRSKEKRSDCPLVTLALVLDGNGFIRRSQIFAGNVSEAATMENMLLKLAAPPGAMVIMDRGVATKANLDWLVEKGYRYIVCKRGSQRQFDDSQAVTVLAQNEDRIRIQKCLSEDGKELHLYCLSPGRQQKEVAINRRFITKFEESLGKLRQSIAKGRKSLDVINERIGRLKEKSHGVSQHYEIIVEADEGGKFAKSITWQLSPVIGGSLTHPGVYCLTTNELGWSEEKLWRTYMMLTDLEAVFRSLKSELGLRPIYHHKEERVDGHLFITVLAYSCVQMLRMTLKQRNIHQSWKSLRTTLLVQRRVTTSFARKNGGSLNVRKCTLPDPELLSLYNALAINTNPGGTKKLIA